MVDGISTQLEQVPPGSVVPCARPLKQRVVLIAVDESSHSDTAVLWAASNVVQPLDHVHVVTALAPTQDPSLTLGVYTILSPCLINWNAVSHRTQNAVVSALQTRCVSIQFERLVM